MHKLMDLKEKLCKELEEFSDKAELSTSDLQTIDWLSHSLKSVQTVLAMEGYSYGDDAEYSYGGRNRDAMGRYSRDDGYSRGAYPYPMRDTNSYGYSYGKESMMQNLKEMRANATNEKERMAIDRCINDMTY